MKNSYCPELPAIRVLTGRIRAPFHRVPVEVAGQITYAWLLQSIDEEKRSERDTLVFTYSEAVIQLLPSNIRRLWHSYNRELRTFKAQWRFGGVATLKRAIRLYRDNQILTHFNLATVVHHFGAVPAMVVAKDKYTKIALLNEMFGYDSGSAPRRDVKTRDLEKSEILASLDEFLPIMLPAYYEQIAFYLRSIFFGPSGYDNAIRFCLKIRQTIGRSIRTKCKEIEQCPETLPKSYELATSLEAKYKRELEEAHGVDSFAHLLVNYVYRFFCINDRVNKYHKVLQPLPSRSGKDLFEESTVALMKRCAQNLLNPEDKFLDEVSKGKEHHPKWLHLLAEVSTFVAEVVNLTQSVRFDKPRLFITHHFKVRDSERFCWLAAYAAGSRYAGKEMVIRGRHLGSDIRWSLLARIWFSNVQIVFLPASWTKVDGTEKTLKDRDDWVLLELLYARLLKKAVRLVVAAPVNEGLLDQFREHISNYTTAKEIEQIPQENWEVFVHKGKKELSDWFHSKKYLECDLDTFGERFWLEFTEKVVGQAAIDVRDAFFEAWCYSFEPNPWSVVQAMILRAGTTGCRTFTIKELAEYILSQASSDERFRWASKYSSSRSLESAIRTFVNELRSFAFNVSGTVFAPLLVKKEGARLQLELRLQELYVTLSENLNTTHSWPDLDRIKEALLVTRNG